MFQDASVFTLPEVAEEEVIDNNNGSGSSKEFRNRAGSGGLKALLKNFKRSRSKSGDSQSSTGESNSIADGDVVTEKSGKGIKAFFRQRSQSDAVAVRNAMLRRRHISSGTSPQQSSSVTTAAADALNNNHVPVQRSRSTSWGAKEKLMMSKQIRISGSSPGSNNMTQMSQMIRGAVPINRKVERVSVY